MNGSINLIEAHACVKDVAFWGELSPQEKLASLVYFISAYCGATNYKYCCVQWDERIREELRIEVQQLKSGLWQE